MFRTALGLLLISSIVLLPAGCSLGPWGGPAYTIDPTRIGTGEQAITPRTDNLFSNGDAADARTRR